MRETSLPQKTEHNELNRATEARFQNLSGASRCGNVCQRRDVRGCEWQRVCWFHQHKRHNSLHMKTYK